jgi:hypothetical protein
MGLTPGLFTSAKPDGTDASKLQPSNWNRVTALLNSLWNGADTHGSVLYRDTADVTDGASFAASAAGVLACAGSGQAPAFRALATADLPAGVPLSLFTSTTAVANVGTAETDLITYTMPGGTLAANGQKVRITAFCTTAANANLKTIKVYFGATALRNTGAAAFNNDAAEITATIIRTGASSQIAMSRIHTTGAFYVGAASPAANLANPVTIKVTGTSNTGSSDVTNTLLFVELVP